MEKRYSVLIVGCGNAGMAHEFDKLRAKPASLYGGVLVFKDRFQICGVCDSDEESLQEAIEHLEEVPGFTCYKEAIKKLNPDVVVIATWTASHCEIFLHSLRNGVKGIVLEKPVGISVSEAEEMLKAWENNQIPVAVNHVRRWERSYRFLRDFIKNEELGPVRSVSGRVLLGAVKEEYEQEVFDLEGGGSMFHDGTHLIDMLLYLFNELEFVSGVVKMGSIIDRSTHALLMGNCEVPVFIEVGGERSFFEYSITVESQFGSCKIGNGIMEWRETEKSRLYEGYKDLVLKPFPHDKLKDYEGGYGYAGPFYDLLEAFDGRGENCCKSFEGGVKGLKLMSEILEKSKKIYAYEGEVDEQ